MYDTESLTKFSFGIGMENTKKILTNTKPKYQIGIQLYSLPGRLVFDIATILVPERPFTQKNHLPVPL
jgi:hypothetical protein